MNRPRSEERLSAAAINRLELLGHMERELGILEDLAAVVVLIFHAGSDQGELTPRQCLAGMRIANQLEGGLTEAHRLYAAIRDTWDAPGCGSATDAPPVKAGRA